jgi:hypothetical protein
MTITADFSRRSPGRRAVRRVLFVLLGSAVFLLLLGVPVRPAEGQESDQDSDVQADIPAGTEVITFDSYPANISGSGAAPPISDEFASQGLLFPRGATALVFDETSFPPRPDLPRSGDTVITSCYSREFCSSVILMAFDPPLSELTLFAGYSASLDEPALLILEGLDGNGEVVGSEEVTIEAAPQATSANTSISVVDAEGRIEGAIVRWADAGRFLSQLIVDDVTVTPFVAAFELTIEPSAVELTVEDEVVRETLTLSNTGNVALPFLTFFTLDGFQNLSDETGAELSADIDEDCLVQMEPGQSCDLILQATPDPENEQELSAEGVLTLRGPSGAPAREIPILVSVTPSPAPVDPPPEQESQPEQEQELEQESVTTDSTSVDPGLVDQPDPDPEPVDWWIPVLIVGVILVLVTIVRRRIRKRRSKRRPPPPRPDEPDRSNERPDRPAPRPTLTGTPDPGTQTVEAPTGAGPTLVIALNEQPAATILIDHNEGSVQ